MIFKMLLVCLIKIEILELNIMEYLDVCLYFIILVLLKLIINFLLNFVMFLFIKILVLFCLLMWIWKENRLVDFLLFFF